MELRSLATIVFVSAGIIAGAWDLLVISRWGLGSGRTVSWQTYTLAKQHPVLPFLLGLLTATLLPGELLPLLVGFVFGHIFGDMRAP